MEFKPKIPLSNRHKELILNKVLDITNNRYLDVLKEEFDKMCIKHKKRFSQINSTTNLSKNHSKALISHSVLIKMKK